MESLLQVAEILTHDEPVFEERVVKQARLELDEQKKLWYKVPKPILDKALAEAH
jgi:hypothetical protein